MDQEHKLGFSITKDRPIRIAVVGAGGNGSSIVQALPFLHQALRSWGHPYGLDVNVIDGDTVSETNCVRQYFTRNEIGQNKAVILASRVNLFCGLSWRATPVFISEKNRNLLDHVDVVIGCVDSKSGRRQIHDAISDSQDTTHYWLDLGNGPDHGQFVLGQPANFSNRTERLKTVADRYPEIIDTATPEDDTPSCSAVEALFNQEPFINQTLAMHALVMLTRLLRYGKLDHQGGFFNARTGTVQPISVATCKAA